MRNRNILMFIIFFMISNHGFAQTGEPFLKNFSIRDYHAHSQNFDLIQDHHGIIYFANFAGIIQYDGTNFTTITTKKISKVNCLLAAEDNKIYVGARGEIGFLQQDEFGKIIFASLTEKIDEKERDFDEILNIVKFQDKIYFFTQKKIFCYSGSQMKTIPLNFKIESIFKFKHKLLISTTNNGLKKYDGKNFEDFFVSNKNEYLSLNYKAILPLNDQTLLFLTEANGIFQFQNNHFSNYPCELNEYLKENLATCAIQLKDGRYAIGTQLGGLVVLSLKSQNWQIINHEKSLLINDHINQLMCDHNDLIWVATNNGISVIDVLSPFSYFNELHHLKGNVTDIVRFDEKFYVSTYQGLFVYSETEKKFQTVSNQIKSCWDLCKDHTKLYAATNEGVWQIKPNLKQITGEMSLALHIEKKNSQKIYVGTTEGVEEIDLQNIQTKKIEGINFEVTAIEEDQNHAIWFQTNSQGIFRYYEQELTNFDETNGLPSRYGNYIHIVDGEIYLTTIQGIFCFNEKQNKFMAEKCLEFEQEDQKKWFFHLMKDQQGNLWTTDGNQRNISFYIRKKNLYQKNDQQLLPVQDFFVQNIYPDDHQVFWFGGPEGIIRFDAKNFKNSSENFETILTHIIIAKDSVLYCGLIDNQFITQIPQVEIQYSDNDIRFEFSSLDYNVKDPPLFQYLLEGYNPNWSEWDQSTVKEYTNLPNANYTFHVRSKNIFGQISDPVAFQFEILTPWYKHFLAYILYVFLLGIFIYVFIKLRSKQLIKEKIALEKTIQERTAEIVESKEEIEEKSKEITLKNDELNKINEVVKAINTQINFTDLLSAILEKMKVIKNFTKAKAIVWNPKNQVYEFKAFLEWDAKLFEKIKLSFEEIELYYLRPCTEIFEDIFLIENFEADLSCEKLKNLPAPKAILMMAVRVNEVVEGFIILENMEEGKPFSEHDLTMISNLKEHVISAFIKTSILQNLETTLDDLTNTQEQLVQSEKLASLGQLTAGIAHEIQNPLNFVNNFSSLSKELIEEIDEIIEENADKIGKDDVEDLQEVLEMLNTNVEKINHHGKRAESIVKGMLMHSRGKSGDFRQVNLNNLVTEYINLAYHGVRAVDKSFNTKLTTRLDDSIGEIKAVPQDLSRVVLNIVNNACYAVNEKAKAQKQGYDPEIIVQTEKKDHSAVIKIKDNGTGMPQKVIDKIFNPFFTTKPTGKGTGLGLSMSYDIITQTHKGTLEVISEDGNFTEFIITLPI